MDIEEAVSSLQGSSGIFLEEFAKDTGVSVDKLIKAAAEQNLFECSMCGWWDDAEDFIGGEPFCHQCLEEHEDG